LQTEQLLCWSGVTDTKHTTSGSNEEEAFCVTLQLLFFQTGISDMDEKDLTTLEMNKLVC